MRITEPQGPFLCPPCAQRLQSSLRYCEGDEHALMPKCPDHHKPLRLTNAGEIASCNQPTGYDAQGGRTWCQTRRNIIHYDAAGRPLPAVEMPVPKKLGRSIPKL